jgi:hypothetical protein
MQAKPQYCQKIKKTLLQTPNSPSLKFPPNNSSQRDSPSSHLLADSGLMVCAAYALCYNYIVNTHTQHSYLLVDG